MSDKKILVIDDNGSMLNIAKIFLKRLNIINVETKTNAKDAIEEITVNNYDLIISDDMMPIMSGTKMMKILKSDPNFNVPIVVLTGNTEIPDPREHYLNEGFDDFLGKPINNAELERIVNKFLNK